MKNDSTMFRKLVDISKPVHVRWCKRLKNPPENKVPCYYRVFKGTAYVSLMTSGVFATLYSIRDGRFMLQMHLDQAEWEVDENGVLVIDRSKFDRVDIKMEDTDFDAWAEKAFA